MSHPIEKLAEEQKILTALLYRNKNQHRNTKVYKCMKQIHHYLKLLPDGAVLHEMLRRSEERIKADTSSSSSSSSSSKAATLTLLLDLRSMLELTCLLRFTAITALAPLKVSLSRVEFVPLYTVLLCCAGSVGDAAGRVAKSLLVYQTALGKILAVGARSNDAAHGEGSGLDAGWESVEQRRRVLRAVEEADLFTEGQEGGGGGSGSSGDGNLSVEAGSAVSVTTSAASTSGQRAPVADAAFASASAGVEDTGEVILGGNIDLSNIGIDAKGSGKPQQGKRPAGGDRYNMVSSKKQR